MSDVTEKISNLSKDVAGTMSDMVGGNTLSEHADRLKTIDVAIEELTAAVRAKAIADANKAYDICAPMKPDFKRAIDA